MIRRLAGVIRQKWWVLLFIVIGFAGLLYLVLPEGGQKTESTKPTTKTHDSSKIRLIATGDTIAHDALNVRARTADGSYDYYQFMKPMQPYFNKADIKFCNQAVPSGGEQFGIKGYPIFNSPLEVVRDLNRLGCNLVNTGTNHTFDGGQSVIDAQLNEWDKQPNMLAVAGANRTIDEQQTVRYFSVKGVRFAFLSYSTYTNITPPNSFGLNMYNPKIAQEQVGKARQQADIVIVSMRWGTEYSPSINNEQTAISQQLASWGADVVLGHGPHVLEPVQLLPGEGGRQTLVWYSLGNFLNAQVETEALVSGVAIMDINVQTKRLEPPKFMPIYMHYDWTAEQKAQENLLSRKNFTLIPLDQAQRLLAQSQNKTTVDEQVARVTEVLNRQTKVTLVTSADY